MHNISQILKGAMHYADEDTDGIKEFCQENLIPDEICEAAERQHMVQSAALAGIPMSVILGKEKLTEHFTQDYIDMKARYRAEIREYKEFAKGKK